MNCYSDAVFMDYGNNNEQKNRFDCGYIQINLETTEKEYPVTFNHSFSKVPVITLSFERSGYMSNTHIGLRQNQVSNTGFVLMALSDKVTINTNIKVYWIAMEP